MKLPLALPTLAILLTGLTVAPLWAQTPGEVQNLVFSDVATLAWDTVSGADHYNIYRGPLSGVDGSDPARCHGFEVAGASFDSPAGPGPGAAYFYLATAESLAAGEGTPGSDSSLAERPLLGRCRPVLRKHVLDRAGFGRDEWSRDRLDTLGIQGYLTEQLDPGSIDEESNTPLKTRLALYEPPSTIIELIAVDVIQAVYARRQLEQQVAAFWSNHFNTFWQKLAGLFQGAYPPCDPQGEPPQCDPNYPQVAHLVTTLAQYREMEEFRHLGFNGNFRQIVEASALSPAMILFLDTFASNGDAPNENFSREMLELYTMGVAGGFTQTDVEELARVFTGWTICKKKLSGLDDPLEQCIANYWEPLPEGQWAANFVPDNHDCQAKTLFLGTPQQADIPETCNDPDTGFNDVQLALDAIASHPSTAQFISKKILERFVTDTPAQSTIDDLVMVWNDPTNPAGVGDLGAVLTAALTHPTFLDPDGVRTKIKTPMEHFASAIRAVRGSTDGVEVILTYLVAASHIPHFNPVPTGWPERGGAWLDTTNTLERQNFGVYLTAFNNAEFGSDLMTLLQDNGVSTAPGNAAGIVDFFVDAFYGGALSPEERQSAIDFLNTDIDGTPGPYDETRIRRTVGYLLGYPQFQEQ